MRKIKITATLALSVLLSLLLLLLLSLTAFASSEAETQANADGSDIELYIVAGIFAFLAVISVILVNKKTKKYRQAFKRRKKKK